MTRRSESHRLHRKGTAFEREVAKAFESEGWHVRGLESGGDQLCIGKDGRVIQVECKRHERVRLPEWMLQLERDKPDDIPGVLVFRQSHRPAYGVVRLDHLLELIGGGNGGGRSRKGTRSPRR